MNDSQSLERGPADELAQLHSALVAARIAQDEADAACAAAIDDGWSIEHLARECQTDIDTVQTSVDRARAARSR